MVNPIYAGSAMILLADDDVEDRELFIDALYEIAPSARLRTAADGIELMEILAERSIAPALLFLDLNMPRMNGYECLNQIRMNENLKEITVVIFSTSFQRDTVNKVYERGASLYIVKPDNFSNLKKVIGTTLDLYENNALFNIKRAKENFILQ